MTIQTFNGVKSFQSQNQKIKSNLNDIALSRSYLVSKSEMETGRVDRPVGLPVGSRFFDRPVKPVEKPVKFTFLATERHLSTNRNLLVYSIINKTFYKKSVLTNHTFRKYLFYGFKL